MTLAELQVAVLHECEALATGESVNASDGAFVSAKYASLYESLLTEGLVSWAASDDIPSFAERPITMMVAHLCSVYAPPSKRSLLEQQGALSLAANKGGPSEAERILRRQLARDFVYSPVQTEYF